MSGLGLESLKPDYAVDKLSTCQKGRTSLGLCPRIMVVSGIVNATPVIDWFFAYYGSGLRGVFHEFGFVCEPYAGLRA